MKKTYRTTIQEELFYPLNRAGNGDASVVNDTTAHFAKWLESSGLKMKKVVGVQLPPSGWQGTDPDSEINKKTAG